MYTEVNNWPSGQCAGNNSTNQSSGEHQAAAYSSSKSNSGGQLSIEAEMDRIGSEQAQFSSRQRRQRSKSREGNGVTTSTNVSLSASLEPINLSRAIVVAAADESIRSSRRSHQKIHINDQQQQQFSSAMQLDLMAAALSKQSMLSRQISPNNFMNTRHDLSQHQQRSAAALAAFEAHRHLSAQFQFASLHGLSAVASALQHQHQHQNTAAAANTPASTSLVQQQQQQEQKPNLDNNSTTMIAAGQNSVGGRRRGLRKCRKMYGLERRQLWCTQCKWKKACSRFCDLRRHNQNHLHHHHHRLHSRAATTAITTSTTTSTTTTINDATTQLSSSHLSNGLNSEQQRQLMMAAAALHNRRGHQQHH